MEILFYFIHLFVALTYSMPVSCTSTQDFRTESSPGKQHADVDHCNFRVESIEEISTLNASYCGLVTLHEVISNYCSACSLTCNKSVNMSRNKMARIDDTECNCSCITEIDFSNNDLSILRDNSFTISQNVKKINMTGNQIYHLEEHVFSGLNILQSLDLSRNALRVIQLNLFNYLRNLRALNLSENKIQHIVSANFIGLNTLKELDLSKNNLHSLGSETFRGFENLRFLDLSVNQLWKQKLDFFTVFSDLAFVNLSRNNFTNFRYDSLNRFNIREIILNDLKRLRYILAGSFRNSKFLAKIDLKGNKNLIFIEDDAFQNIPNLTTIDISFTGLQSLPYISNTTTCIAIGTPLDNECLSNLSMDSTQLKTVQPAHTYEPKILSQIATNYFLAIGQNLTIDCFVIGFQKPRVIWKRLYFYPNGSNSLSEVLTQGYFLDLHISALNMEGSYRCEADANGTKVHKDFQINIKHIDVGIWVLSRNPDSVLVAWNKTLQAQRHVLLYRAYETTSNYVIRRLNEYWKVFVIRSLQPFTEYEICIASFSDINDKSCVRTMTRRREMSTVGIRHNGLAIAFLAISGIIFGIFLVTALLKCVNKVRIITKQNVFIVGSESRECFADVTESTFTYENQHTDLLIDKTEL